MCDVLGLQQTQNGRGEAYIGHKLKGAITSRWPVFCVGIGTSGAGASVLPVTLRSEIAVGLSDIAAATSGTIG